MTVRPDPEILESIRNRLFALRGVQAVGESEIDGDFCLKVYFDSERSLTAAGIEHIVEGVRITTTVSGVIRSQRK